MSESKWVKVFKADSVPSALFAQAILSEHDIESVLLNQLDSTNITLGYVHVMVNEWQAEEAKLLLDSEISTPDDNQE